MSSLISPASHISNEIQAKCRSQNVLHLTLLNCKNYYLWSCWNVTSLPCLSKLTRAALFFYYSKSLMSPNQGCGCMYCICCTQGATHPYKHMHIQTCKQTHSTHTDSYTRSHSLKALIRHAAECISVWSFEEKTCKRLLCSEQRFVWCCRSTWLRGALAVVGCFEAVIKKDFSTAAFL